jgi:CTP:molybdopterin cytidylyltransferase MocA
MLMGVTLDGVVAVVLAAGGGRRIGGPKALLRHEGQYLVERAIAVARAGGCETVVVVIGAQADRVRELANLDGVLVVENPAWSKGMGTSLGAGLTALLESGVPADAALVMLVDTPGITPAAVARVIALPYRAALVSATYSGRRGHPVMLGRDHWTGVTALATGDVGARAYLSAHAGRVQTVSCDDVADDTDIDTPEAARDYGITYTVADD